MKFLILLFPLCASAGTRIYDGPPSQKSDRVDSVSISRPKDQSPAPATQGNPVVLGFGGDPEPLGSIRSGEGYTLRVSQSVVAIPVAESPVTGSIQDRDGNWYTVSGRATLEAHSERILIEFDQIRTSQSAETFSFRGSAHTASGKLGLDADVKSSESELFAAELLSGTAAAFTDTKGGISNYGFERQSDSLDSKAGRGMTSALTSTAQHFANKLKAAQKFAVARGPHDLRIIILKAPTFPKPERN